MEPQAFINEDILTMLLKHTDPIAIVLVILGGLFAKKYLQEIVFMGDTWKTLIMSTIFISGYITILYISGELYKEDYLKYFMSYCFATTLYDTLLKHLIEKIPYFKVSKPRRSKPTL